MDNESPSTPAPTEAPDPMASYDVPAYRFTIALDVRASSPAFATELVLGICRELANLAVNPLGGAALHDAIGGRMLNLLCFNDPTPCTEPINPQEVMAMRAMVEQLQAGDGSALQALFGGLGNGALAGDQQAEDTAADVAGDEQGTGADW